MRGRCSARSQDPIPGPRSHTLDLEPLNQPVHLRWNLTSTCTSRLISTQARTIVSPCMVIPLTFEHWTCSAQAQCKVNNPFDHLDQAESYPVDEDNPIEYSAQEYKIYSTSD